MRSQISTILNTHLHLKKAWPRLLLCALSLLYSALALSQDRPRHYLGLGVEGGASHLFLTENANPLHRYSTPKIGFFGGGELVYELQYNHFLFRTGINVLYSCNRNTYNPPEQSRQIDEYSTMQYHYRFSNFSEETRWGNCYLPILFGGKFNSFFFLAGAKIGFLPFSAKSKSSTDVYIWGTDEDVINPMEGLYTHDMGNYSFEGEWNSVSLENINVMLSVEFGISLNDRELNTTRPLTQEEIFKEKTTKKKFSDRLHYRLSIFFDYGLTNMLVYKPNAIPYYSESGIQEEGGLIDIPKVNIVNPYSLYGYDPHKDAFLNSFFAGLKFVILYQPQPVKHKKKCNCLPRDRQALKWKQIPTQK